MDDDFDYSDDNLDVPVVEDSYEDMIEEGKRMKNKKKSNSDDDDFSDENGDFIPNLDDTDEESDETNWDNDEEM